MDSSRRAVEAYWRSRMVDGVTSDEDKVAPVYKLEEICDLLRNSHVSIVKEVSDYVLKRLDHKSPLVKQKALRLIKYTVGKSGVEFRREMQRHSAVVRQLFHYKGQPDPLKGDAPNKAVRDTAHEAVTAIFADDDGKAVAPSEGIQKRIEGFGNTNYEMPVEDKKSFLSEVVGIGLSTIAAANSIRKNDNGSYKSPNLRRSLTTEAGDRDRDGYFSDNHSSGSSGNLSSMWRENMKMVVNEEPTHSHTGTKSREERLLETVVTSGGVRLQPTRDAIQVFLTEAMKLDAMALSQALEVKLQSPLWQVRMKACCVLESILRKKDDTHFSVVASYFCENKDSLVKCSELPQVSLREKASRVLSILDGNQVSGTGKETESSNAKPEPVPAVRMPDLIDTGDADDYGSEHSTLKHVDQNLGDVVPSSSLVDDLFGDQPSSLSNSNRGEDDPFADVSFHMTNDKQQDDLFSGLTVDDKSCESVEKVPMSNGSSLLNVFSSNSDMGPDKGSMHDLMAGLSLNNAVHLKNQPDAFFVDGINQSSQMSMNQSNQIQMPTNPLNQMPVNGVPNSGFGPNTFFPMGSVHYDMPPSMLINPAFAAQPVNYSAMGAFIAQQQLLFQNLGNLNTVYGHGHGDATDGAHSSALPDIFQHSNNAGQTTMLTSTKKAETKAFDFISDHLSAARDSKRVL